MGSRKRCNALAATALSSLITGQACLPPSLLPRMLNSPAHTLGGRRSHELQRRHTHARCRLGCGVAVASAARSYCCNDGSLLAVQPRRAAAAEKVRRVCNNHAYVDQQQLPAATAAAVHASSPVKWWRSPSLCSSGSNDRHPLRGFRALLLLRRRR